jgi:hypothetical protein
MGKNSAGDIYAASIGSEITNGTCTGVNRDETATYAENPNGRNGSFFINFECKTN